MGRSESLVLQGRLDLILLFFYEAYDPYRESKRNKQ